MGFGRDLCIPIARGTTCLGQCHIRMFLYLSCYTVIETETDRRLWGHGCAKVYCLLISQNCEYLAHRPAQTACVTYQYTTRHVSILLDTSVYY